MSKNRMSLENVFSKSWDAYKKNIGPLLLVVLLGMILMGIFLIPGLITFLITIAGSGGQDLAINSFFIIGMLIFGVSILLSVLASIVYGAAMIKAASFAEGGHKINIKEVFSVAYQKFWPILGTSLLAGVFMIIGFILLIIPGLVLVVYFQFIIYVVIFEGKWGMEAVSRSYEIVKGNFWWVVLIILIVSLVSGLIGLVPFVGSIVAFILTPLWQVIMYVVYKDLKSIKD